MRGPLTRKQRWALFRKGIGLPPKRKHTLDEACEIHWGRKTGMEQRVLIAALYEPSLLPELKRRTKPRQFRTPGHCALAGALQRCKPDSA
jgi:hypothetical protein